MSECTSYLNKYANKRNCRDWNDENPRHLREGHTEHLQKVIISTLFREGNLNDEMYNDILKRSVEVLVVRESKNQRDDYGNLC